MDDTKILLKNKEKTIVEAIYNGYKIRIVYMSGQMHNNYKITERIIKPFEMKNGQDFNDNQLIRNSKYAQTQIYIRAFCELRQDERHFRLDRIINLSIITEH